MKMSKNISLGDHYLLQEKFFQKKILSQNINLEDHYLLKNLFFLNSIFEPLYFLKLRPIFERLSLLIGIF